MICPLKLATNTHFAGVQPLPLNAEVPRSLIIYLFMFKVAQHDFIGMNVSAALPLMPRNQLPMATARASSALVLTADVLAWFELCGFYSLEAQEYFFRLESFPEAHG